MIDLNDIHTLNDFQRDLQTYLDRIKETGNPVVLTVNGQAEIVVQDAASYQALLDRVERTETVSAVRQAMDEFERGEGRSAREALEELRAKHGVSG